MKISYLEIYNEIVNDLLDKNNQNLDVRIGNNGCVINGLTEKLVEEEITVFEWLELGESNRKVAATDYNETSSRSHTVFRIHLEMIKKSGISDQTYNAEINLVDLAGSEGVSSDLDPERVIERSNINRSLLALKMIIQSNSSRSKNHQTGSHSYRQSKLTRILQNALSGNSKTCII